VRRAVAAVASAFAIGCWVAPRAQDPPRLVVALDRMAEASRALGVACDHCHRVVDGRVAGFSDRGRAVVAYRHFRLADRFGVRCATCHHPHGLTAKGLLAWRDLRDPSRRDCGSCHGAKFSLR
jgi:hypothetical protein